ncbi:hypothetical protein Plhal304r1_c007g0027731 [Plasmopara halstedii]
MSLQSHSVGGDEVKTFTRYGKHLRQILHPIFDDLQLRLAFQLHPVSSRFRFLLQSNPRITYCVHNGCYAVETERHLFFECALASRMWKHFENIMPPFNRIHSDEWEECEDVIGDIWHTFRAVTLHFVWSDRNRCQFDASQPTPTTPALLMVFSVACAHFRCNLRQCYDIVDEMRFEKGISAMRGKTYFGDYEALNPASICTQYCLLTTDILFANKTFMRRKRRKISRHKHVYE